MNSHTDRGLAASDRMAARLGWGNVAVVVALITMTIVLAVLGRGSRAITGFDADIAFAPVTLLLAALGAVVVARGSANAIGAGMGLAGLLLAVVAASDQYATYGLVDEPGALPAASVAAWLAAWLWTWAIAFVAMFMLLAPTGRLLSPRWRPVLFADLGVVALFSVAIALVPGELRDYPGTENPLGIGAARDLLLVVEGVCFVLVNLVVVLSAAGLIVRFRRSRGVERQQLKWLAAAAVGAGLVFLLGFVVSIVFVDAWSYCIVVGFSLLPIGAAIAILRYRLYDIDILINRTLVYGSLTAATVGSYVLLVVGLGWVARAILGQGSNEIAVAATTLIVAALVQPARRQLQKLVDRRFYRATYDASRTLEAFQGRLREELDIESLRSELAAAVHQALQPASVGVWLRRGRQW